ncbi:MAG: Aspartate aminotransferase [Methanoregulaceae archaeon PtaB.Bin108]|nr:MAG: Aspartate aminotransferase [Methanoregulaceae archaeon PtaB.Bin108]
MIPIAKPSLDEEEVDAVSRVIRSGMLAKGPRVEEFERGFSVYCGTKHGVAMNSGTAALHAALLALGIGPGDEVIVPAFTFFATASSVCMCGATPVFADVDPDTFNISVDKVAEAVNQRTKAVIGVHLFGQPFDVQPILEICDERGIPLLEDAAQAHGAEYHGKKTGSMGMAGCFSFYPTKNMTTGEGGMVTTSDMALSSRMRQIIDHGQEKKYFHTRIGYNYRMTDMAAALGLVQLKKLDRMNRRRREIASHYDSHIRGRGIERPVATSDITHVYHQYVVKVTGECPISRDQLAAYLLKKGIGTAVHYPLTVHRQPVFSGSKSCVCPVSEELSRTVLSLPVHPGVTDQECKYICEVLNEVT